MVDNFDLILSILPETPENDLSYYCQIIKRKKDHPNLKGKNNSARLVKPYYFTCKQDMLDRKDEMISISEATGARIMMDAFPKSRSKVKYEMLIRLAKIIQGDNDAKLHRLYNTCYGQLDSPKGRSLWLIDWDYKDTTILDKAIEKVNELKIHNSLAEVVLKVPTRQGWHYIVKPFYLKPLIDYFHENNIVVPDIHKTSPTLVYIPKSLESESK